MAILAFVFERPLLVIGSICENQDFGQAIRSTWSYPPEILGAVEWLEALETQLSCHNYLAFFGAFWSLILVN